MYNKNTGFYDERQIFSAVTFIASKSTCKGRQVGAFIYDKSTGYIFGVGTNSPIDGLCEDECLRRQRKIPSGTRLDECFSVHAEQRALIDALKRLSPVDDSTDLVIACNVQPCIHCAKLLIEAGITTVVYVYDYPDKKGLELFDCRAYVHKIDPDEYEHSEQDTLIQRVLASFMTSNDSDTKAFNREFRKTHLVNILPEDDEAVVVTRDELMGAVKDCGRVKKFRMEDGNLVGTFIPSSNGAVKPEKFLNTGFSLSRVPLVNRDPEGNFIITDKNSKSGDSVTLSPEEFKVTCDKLHWDWNAFPDSPSGYVVTEHKFVDADQNGGPVIPRRDVSGEIEFVSEIDGIDVSYTFEKDENNECD